MTNEDKTRGKKSGRQKPNTLNAKASQSYRRTRQILDRHRLLLSMANKRKLTNRAKK
jgi:hypothetical protein